MFDIHKNTTAMAAMLCPAVCISDFIIKADMCVKMIKHVTNQAFLLFIGKEWISMVVPRETKDLKQNSTSFL